MIDQTQTSPAIELAKQGTLADIFDTIVPVTEQDAQFVHFNDNSRYQLEPALSAYDKIQFSSLEQALALVALINFKYPGSQLTVVDNAIAFAYPGFRKLQYGNAGGLSDPRVYKVIGTISVDGVDSPTEFNVGYNINVKRILQGGINLWTAKLGYPEGNSTLVVVNEMGLDQPEWVGQK